MKDVALRMENVYKKFKRGERHDTLRDLVPALTKRLFKRTSSSALGQSEFWALNDVSFEIGRGEAVGIIGHNGAGKSTMLKHLSGIMKPTTGKIHVNGRLSALIEVGAGFHQDLTGRENVYLNGVILGMSRAEIRNKFDEIVEFSGLGAFIDTPVKRYSSGMHARLGFAVAAHLEPDILIIDEVLSVGDYMFQSKGIAKMREIAQSGATVIFVSHNLAAVAGLCSRSLLMKNGALLQDGPTPDIIRTYMQQISAARTLSTDKALMIESLMLSDANGPRLSFNAGDEMNVDIKLHANSAVRNISCVLYIKDKQYYTVFNISPDRLGLGFLTLGAGETCTYRFKLKLDLAPGAFHACVSLLEHHTSNSLDVLEPAATFLVDSEVEVGGAANLYPTATLTLSDRESDRSGSPIRAAM